MYKRSYNIQGFTLAELAIVLVIMTLLISGMLIPIGAQIQNRRISETQKNMEEIKEALLGFAMVNGYLPCPANSEIDGTAKTVCSTHADATGFIPWTTLGTNRVDAWGKIIRYSVTPAFTVNTPITPITYESKGSKHINVYNASGTMNPYTDLAFVLLSFGAKNFGRSENGNLIPNTSTTNAFEQQNNTADGNSGAGHEFISAPVTDLTTGPGGEFDDIVVWSPYSILIKSMSNAGKIPPPS